MSDEFKQIGTLKEIRSLKVCVKGTGLALYLTKDLVDLYGIMAGDLVKAKLEEHYRPKKDREN